MKKLFAFFLLFLPLLLNAQKTITVEDIWSKYLFYPKGVRGYTPVPNGNEYSVVGIAGIVKHSFETGEMTEVVLPTTKIPEMSNNKIELNDLSDYSFDQSEQKILLAVKEESIYRRSSKAFYYVYDKRRGRIVPLSDEKKGKQSFSFVSLCHQKRK